ncbi:MAG: methyltransferase domain-containing protein [Muribaculaceae bacterium]|nr:methyltransferase domain-containing protein [Muribaculaceae bacterium]
MQRHAILIFSHNPLENLVPIIEYFDNEFDLFIHYDKRISLDEEELNAFLTKYPHIRFYRRYRFKWGGIPIVKAELKLLSIILDTDSYAYIHIISDSDRPIKSLSEFKSFFDKNKGKEYVGCFPLPDRRWENGTFGRFELFRLNDLFNYRSKLGKFIIDLANDLQQKLNVRRSDRSLCSNLYGGSTWMSITAQCAAHIVANQTKYRPFFKRLRFTFGADEVFLQTMIMNSPFSAKVVFDDCRYTKWRQGSPSPEWLTMKDCFDVATSQKVFARKFHPTKSASLWEWIGHNLISMGTPKIGDHGQWLSYDYSGHVFDGGLAECIFEIVSQNDMETVVDMGCGPGWYVAYLRRLGIRAYGYDANPHTDTISTHLFKSNYHCECLDLSEEVIFSKPFELVISIEVGEHIPKEFQNTFLDNLANNCSNCLLLSWAVPEQAGDGHINLKTNEWVIDQITQRGLIFNREKTILYRSKCNHNWLKKSLMFFERVPTGIKLFCDGKPRYNR